jgi:VCBS repeat-containing protein
MQLVELESREVPATFVVTTNAESTPGDNFLSLREAVIAANANPGDDTIILTTGTHTLSLAGANENAAATGDLDITDTSGKTTIESALLVPDAVFSVVDIGGLDRVFEVHPGVQLELKGIAVRNGGNVSNGGGIHNLGSLTLNNVDFKSNFAVLRGGAIDNNSSSASVVMTRGKFEGNGATAVTTLPIGGAINVGGGSINIAGAIFGGNTAGEGGAINARSSFVSITDTFFAFNSALNGGAIATMGGNLFVTNSQFNDNKATLSASVSTNPGGKGGAILNRGEARVNRSTFIRNAASGTNGQGGAIHTASYLEVVNSTISNNVAGNLTASNPVSVGGGIANTAGTLRLFSSTVVENRSLLSSSVGGGVYNVAAVGSVVSGFIQNTIVARNNFGINSNTPDITGTFTSTGGNLIGISVGSSGWIASDYLGTFLNPINPLLGLVGNNGGLTQTRPLLAGSPAQDKGVLNANTPATDQRGQPRPSGSGVDIGAFEYQIDARPTAENDFYFTFEDTKYVADGAGVFLNDFDPNGRPLTAELLSGPNFGTLTFNTNGTFAYTPAPNFNGTDVFTYRVTNDAGFSAEASAFFNVGAVNDPPVANSDAASTPEDTPVVGTLTASDVENDPLTFALADNAANGTVTVASNGTFTYTPNANFHGNDSFTFRANDGTSDSKLATLTITVTPVNDAPTAIDAAAGTDEDTTLAGTLLGADVDGDTLSFALIGTAQNGTVTVNPNGSYSYTPNANFHGTDSFTFRANDGTENSNTATVAITVNPVNDAPTLSPATFTLPENSPNGTSVGTIGGADVDGDALTYSIVGGNTAGAFAIDPTTGAITVANSAALDFETTPSFALAVQATDAGGLIAQVTVTVNLSDANEVPPIAIDVLPGNAGNEIRLRTAKTIEVAILSSAQFDARTVDVTSLRFGRTGTEDSIARNRKTGAVQFSLRDVNGDGRLDLVASYDVKKSGFQVGDTRAILTGRLANGLAFTAEDTIRVRN